MRVKKRVGRRSCEFYVSVIVNVNVALGGRLYSIDG